MEDSINSIRIKINEVESCIEMIDTQKVLISNVRLKLKLKNFYNADIKDNKILVRFDSNLHSDKEEKLNEILSFLNKLNVHITKDESTSSALDEFLQNKSNFKNFSRKAKDIWNNKYDINDFSDFKSVLEEKFKRTLYPLQLLSAYHLTFSQNACNFSVPGAGKTSIVYAAYSYLKTLKDTNPQKYVNKILIIGPKSSFDPWEDEYRECFKEIPEENFIQKISDDLTTQGKRNYFFSQYVKDVTIISHQGVIGLKEEIISFLKRNPHTMLIVDEAHKIKNVETGIRSEIIREFAKYAKSRVALTGTPVPNGYQDLYALYQFIWPYDYKEILGFHYQNLLDLTKDARENDPRVGKLIENISPFFIRIKKSDLMLPPVKEMPVIMVDMNPKQKVIYDYIESKYIKHFQNYSPDNTFKHKLDQARLIRLRQAAINPSLLNTALEDYYQDNGLPNNLGIDDGEVISMISKYYGSEVPSKFQKVREILSNELLSNGEKVIIWTIFIQNAIELKDYLDNSGIITKLLIGLTPDEERSNIIRKFNNPNDSSFQVVIANPYVVAESISLHKGCHTAIYLERDYNCANFIQSKDRIHRVGMKKNQITKYFYIITKNSIDERIHDILNKKTERMLQIIEQDIPLINSNRDYEEDEGDLIKSLIRDYVKRTQNI